MGARRILRFPRPDLELPRSSAYSPYLSKVSFFFPLWCPPRVGRTRRVHEGDVGERDVELLLLSDGGEHLVELGDAAQVVGVKALQPVPAAPPQVVVERPDVVAVRLRQRREPTPRRPTLRDRNILMTHIRPN